MGRQLVVACLLENSADPNVRDSEEETPLHVAARRGLRVLVELLLQAKANPALRNKHGLTPYEVASQSDGHKPQNTRCPVKTLLKQAEEKARVNNASSSSPHLEDSLCSEVMKGQCLLKGPTSGGSSSVMVRILLRLTVAYVNDGLIIVVYAKCRQLSSVKRDSAKVTHMEKSWWKLFLSQRQEFHKLPFWQKGSEVGVTSLRQMALLQCLRRDLVSELVYYGVNEKKEIGFHRTEFFSQLLHELVDRVGKTTLDSLQEFISKKDHSACRLLDADTMDGDADLQGNLPGSNNFFKELFLCLPAEGYLDPFQMPMHFKSMKVNIGNLSRTSTWEELKIALENGLPSLIGQAPNFTLNAEQIKAGFELVFFVRYAWESGQKLPMPLLRVAKVSSDWLCTVRRPFKIQDTLVADSTGRACPMFSTGVFLPSMEIYACYRSKEEARGIKSTAKDQPNSPPRKRGKQRKAMCGDHLPGSSEGNTNSIGTEGKQRQCSHDVFSKPFRELYTYLVYGKDGLGADPNVMERGNTLAHHAAETGDINRLALLVFFGTDVHIKNRKGKTIMEVAAEYQHHQVVDFLLWLEQRDLAFGGTVGEPAIANPSASQQSSSLECPPSRLPIGSTIASPNGQMYQIMTTPTRKMDCNGVDLIYDVQRVWPASDMVFSGDMTLKLIGDMNEIARLRDACHVGSPFIIEVIDGFAYNLPDVTGVGGGRRWGALVMPRCTMTLDERIAGGGRIKPEGDGGVGFYGQVEAYKWSSQIAEGLKALQAAGVVHGDIRPCNILVQRSFDEGGNEEEIIKLANFGAAQRCDHWGVMKGVGGGAFMHVTSAPELCVGGQAMDYAADCFSLGVVLVMLLTKRPEVVFHGQGEPFVTVAKDPSMRQILGDMLKESGVHSEVAVEVVTGLLVYDWPDRLTASVASRLLESLWSPHVPVVPETVADAANIPLTFHVGPKVSPLLLELYRCEDEWWRAKSGVGKSIKVSVRENFRTLWALAGVNYGLGNHLRARELYQRAVDLRSEGDEHDCVPPALMVEAMDTLSKLNNELLERNKMRQMEKDGVYHPSPGVGSSRRLLGEEEIAEQNNVASGMIQEEADGGADGGEEGRRKHRRSGGGVCL